MKTGLVTGSQPFAGLPDSPSQTLLSHLDGLEFGDVRIHTVATDVSLERVAGNMAKLIAEHRPAFVVSLGLAPGECVMRCETTSINRLDFGVADNYGQRPAYGRPIDPDGPPARLATWDAHGLAARIRAAGLPARVSHFAGTHLCNTTLYAALGAMEAAGLDGPCGFFHLPYLPEQVARFMSEGPPGGDTAPLTPRALPSMALADQIAGLRILLAALSSTANGDVS
ncbi:pyroglutamyl-peptidase I family protein [Roseisalinus antarcticus]|uniref:Pyrrolidone-carboxylate peptidase n=1 Tax=Roseisalinus antarcticus TaxID=254357 RepID=A0A1Y5SJH2_9RHOB|nr:hypothetical protein [Roseisalinus antarcticus]SLN42081.1 Pyrrolidone-carboxylate peptidase [Roseisalinus antarcticus]